MFLPPSCLPLTFPPLPPYAFYSSPKPITFPYIPLNTSSHSLKPFPSPFLPYTFPSSSSLPQTFPYHFIVFYLSVTCYNPSFSPPLLILLLLLFVLLCLFFLSLLVSPSFCPLLLHFLFNCRLFRSLPILSFLHYRADLPFSFIWQYCYRGFTLLKVGGNNDLRLCVCVCVCVCVCASSSLSRLTATKINPNCSSDHCVQLLSFLCYVDSNDIT